MFVILEYGLYGINLLAMSTILRWSTYVIVLVLSMVPHTFSSSPAHEMDHLVPSLSSSPPSVAMFSNVDKLIFFTLGCGAICYLVLRRKKEEPVHIRTLTAIPAAVNANDTGFISRMKSSHRNVIVFYGSQTGTGEEFAGRLAKEAGRYSMKGMAIDPEECDMEELENLKLIPNSLAIFCLATYGEGDPTDNAQEFHDWLQTTEADLQGLNYAVFGLGNKTYEHFNDFGKFVDRKLEELGGHRIYKLGLGDDDSIIEDDFLTWKENFWQAVCDYYGVKFTGDDVGARQFTLSIQEELPCEDIFRGEVARLKTFQNQKPPYDAKNPFLASVTVNRELHKAGDRSCMHIEFDIRGSRLRYEAGDHVAVFPLNDCELVEKMAKLTEADLDTVITLTNVDEEASKKNPFPCPCSYRTALSHYLDITSHPHTHVIKELAEFASNPDDKEFLLKMTKSTPEGKNLYNDWIIKDHRTIVSILEDVKSLRVPLDLICELLPRLHARYYSISSSPKMYPDTVHITAILVNYETRIGRAVHGVATKWLKGKIPVEGVKHRVPIYIRRSQFRLPFKTVTPVIMIGPGTGLAPFRGFIQDRNHAKTEGKPMGDTILYTGFRKKAEDYLYDGELESYRDDGTLSELHVAFSRDQETKVYVQHLLKENSEKLWKLLEKGAHFYVCGDARNMARDVHAVLADVIRNKGGRTSEQAEAYIKKLQMKGRYCCDVWS